MLEFVRKRPLFCLLVLAFVLRVIAGGILQYQLEHVWHRPFLIPGDAEGYWELAQNLIQHQTFQLYDPPRQIMRMPGFPALLAAAMSVFGENWLALRVVLAAVGTAACGLVYVMGRQLFDAPTALLAGLLAAISPVMIGFSELVLSETLFALALLVCVITLVWYDRSRRAAQGRHSCWWQACLAGTSIAAATYVRPSWLAVAPLAAVLIVAAGRARRTSWIEAGALLVGVILALSPWIARNYRVTGGHVVATTLWAGPSLYDGLNPNANGDSDMQFYEDDALMNAHGYSEYEMNRYYTHKAREFALANPGRALQLAGAKLWRYWKPWPNAAQFGDWRLQVIAAVSFLIILLPATIAWAANWKRPEVWLPTVGPILLFAGIHAVFVGSIRYRLPAEYPLCVLSAAGLRSLAAGWRSRA